MGCISLICWLTVVGAGTLLDTGSALPAVYQWKILSQATGMFVGVADGAATAGSKAVLGNRSFAGELFCCMTCGTCRQCAIAKSSAITYHTGGVLLKILYTMHV